MLVGRDFQIAGALKLSKRLSTPLIMVLADGIWRRLLELDLSLLAECLTCKQVP